MAFRRGSVNVQRMETSCFSSPLRAAGGNGPTCSGGRGEAAAERASFLAGPALEETEPTGFLERNWEMALREVYVTVKFPN